VPSPEKRFRSVFDSTMRYRAAQCQHPEEGPVVQGDPQSSRSVQRQRWTGEIGHRECPYGHSREEEETADESPPERPAARQRVATDQPIQSNSDGSAADRVLKQQRKIPGS